MILLYIIGIFILLTLGLIAVSIVLKWMNKQNTGYIEVNIDEWKKMNIVNMELRKRKAILEREVIQIILDNE
ncbi:hypothetical protein ACR77J_13985 [Tissierella praeacuta]|uniref:hypothetical protein n=1 Tax=Tissierella praeacuta TaxID=43131 RepID=UPI003DA2BCE8